MWACYGFTYSYPFFFDDFGNITGNPAIRDITEPLRIIRFNPLRPVTYFTFALNYLLWGNSVTGYHIVNILIHTTNSILVWMLVRKLYQTPVMRPSLVYRDLETIAFFTALVFAVHPLMTEAVTYLVQRLVSLSTMFFLISVILYIRIRSEKFSHSGKILTIVGLIVSSLLAFFTRENTWVLPLVLLVTERTFFNQTTGHRKWFTGQVIFTSLMFLLIVVYVIWSDKYFKPIPPLETHTYTITLPVYYLTQICVISSYLNLILLPIGQVFDRAFPIALSVTEPKVILCSLLLVAYIFLLFKIRKKHPLLFFSLLWFLITVLPQSIVPRPNVFFEHRSYLPSIGIIISVVSLVFIAGRHIGKKPQLIFYILIPLLMILTISRNLVWHDEISLWKDTVSKSPDNARAWSNLGQAEYNRKNFSAAESAFSSAVKITPQLAEFWYNLALAEQMQDKPQQAIHSISQAIQLDSGNAMYYHDRGVFYAMAQNYPQAISDFSQAIFLEPGLRSALLNRSRAYELIGDTTHSKDDLGDGGN